MALGRMGARRESKRRYLCNYDLLGLTCRILEYDLGILHCHMYMYMCMLHARVRVHARARVRVHVYV